MSDDVLRAVIEDKVMYLTMNRPDKLNALNGPMIEALHTNLHKAAGDPEIGAVVLMGEGRAFCAGGDVSAMAAGREGPPPTTEQSVDGLRAGQEMCWTLHSMPKVTIAAVNGFAMGAGLGIAMSCDLRIAADTAKLGTAYAKVGFGGDYGTTWQLTQLVGEAKAKELMFLADIIDAAEAHRIGLVNRVIPKEGFEESVRQLATQIAHGPLVSYRYMKENINLAVRSDFRTILDREAFTHVLCGRTDDHKEGTAAFMEKRQPQFQGR